MPPGDSGEDKAPDNKRADDDVAEPAKASRENVGEAADPALSSGDEGKVEKSVSRKGSAQGDFAMSPPDAESDAPATSARSDRSEGDNNDSSKEAGTSSADAAQEQNSAGGSDVDDDKSGSEGGAAVAVEGGGDDSDGEGEHKSDTGNDGEGR